MKKPNTPMLSRMSQRKNSLGRGLIFQEAKEPVSRMMLESISIAMEMPSTPTLSLMLSAENQVQSPR